MKMLKDNTLHVRVPADLRNRLMQAAEKDDLPQGYLVRRAIAEYLDRNQKPSEVA